MKKLILLFAFVFVSLNIFSQKKYIKNDFGTWAGFALEHKIKKLKLNFSQQIRTYNNSLKIDDYIADFETKYSINKSFKLNANIRFIHNAKRNSISENNIRYQIGINYKLKFSKKINIVYKLSYQQEFINLLADSNPNKTFFSDFRNKIKLNYRLKNKHNFYFSSELFRLFKTSQKAYFSKIRFYLGDKITIKKSEINIAIGFQQDLTPIYPTSFIFLKTVYTLNLKK